MRTGELASRAGLTDRTVRYYEKIGVLPAPDRTASGYRDYAPEALTRLAFVRAAQTAGLTLAEIAGILALRDRGEAPCGHVEALIETKLVEVAEKIRELEATCTELRTLARRASELDPTACDDGDICHILNRHRGVTTRACRNHG